MLGRGMREGRMRKVETRENREDERLGLRRGRRLWDNE